MGMVEAAARPRASTVGRVSGEDASVLPGRGEVEMRRQLL